MVGSFFYTLLNTTTYENSIFYQFNFKFGNEILHIIYSINSLH